MNLEHTESLICGDRAAFGPFIGPAGIKGRLTVKSLLLVGPEHPLLEAVDAFILIVRLGNDSFELSFLPSGAVEKSRPGEPVTPTPPIPIFELPRSSPFDVGVVGMSSSKSKEFRKTVRKHLESPLHSFFLVDRSSGQSKPIFDETW